VVLATLGLLGIEEIWALGGAHGVAALALGTSPVAKVDMIVGPGNVYVTEAKRLLFGEVGIDGLAGPSEVLVVADETASPDLIAADLLAQAEHDPLARSLLLALDEKTASASLAATEKLLEALPEENARIARESWNRGGLVAVCTLEEAAAFANRLAPEHLELAVANPESILPRFTAYGAVFLGHFSAEAFGDYVAGTNHILPTEGRARFGGGLWTGTFLRPLQQLRLSQEGARTLTEAGNTLATAEGLAAHALAMTRRGISS
jgi:histidinol dehydrogenase/sulfopropanediol 3-dehydrogenase